MMVANNIVVWFSYKKYLAELLIKLSILLLVKAHKSKSNVEPCTKKSDIKEKIHGDTKEKN